jgi:membrane fusion protein (multidrug efflux system)
MKRPMIIMLVTVGLFFAAVFGWKAFVTRQIQKSMQATPFPPMTVSTTVAGADTWTPVINAIGSLRAVQGVDVTAQVAGQITQLHFDSGDVVAKDDLLLQQYTADERAQLEGLVAERKLAELNFKRLQDLSSKQLVSEFDFDSGRTELQRAEAAEVTLRLNIAKKSIHAPFAGQLGLRRIDLGQYVEPGDVLVRLEAIDRLLVDFPVSQRQISRLYAEQPIAVYVDAWPEQRFVGVIDAIDPQIELDTRNVRVRGVLDNADTRLLPGMFVRVEIQLPDQTEVVTVPQSAVTYSPYGDSVFVIDEQQGADGTPLLSVVNTFVVPGATRGDQVAIQSGLAAGVTVVTAGQQKLRNGARVVVDNSVPVSNNPAPQPANN